MPDFNFYKADATTLDGRFGEDFIGREAWFRLLIQLRDQGVDQRYEAYLHLLDGFYGNVEEIARSLPVRRECRWRSLQGLNTKSMTGSIKHLTRPSTHASRRKSSRNGTVTSLRLYLSLKAAIDAAKLA